MQGIRHDGDGGTRVYEAAEVDLSQLNDKPGAHGKQEHEIEFAGADQVVLVVGVL